MIRKPSDSETIGLAIDGDRLKLVQVITARGQVKIKRCEEFFLDTIEGKLSFRSEKEAKICEELTEQFLTVANLEGKDVLVRKLKIKLLKEKDIEAVFPFEAESILPYPVEEAVLDKIFLEKQEDTTSLNLIAAKLPSVEGCLKKYHDLKIDPEILTCEPASLAAFQSRFIPDVNDILIVHVGLRTSLGVLVNQGKLLSSHSLSIGVQFLKDAYEEDQKKEPELLEVPFHQFDFVSEDLNLCPQLKLALAKLKQEVQWMILSEIKNYKNPSQLSFVSVGEGTGLKGLDQVLYQEIDLKRIEVTTKDGMELNQTLLKRFAIAIGSALSALPAYPNPVNLRQGAFDYPNPWRRYKKSLIFFAGASLLLAMMFYMFGQAYLGLKEDQLKENYISTLASVNKSYPQFEKEFSKSKKTEQPVSSVKDLSLNDLLLRLNALEKEIKAEPDVFPLKPGVPLVADTLAWLSNHPQMRGVQDEEGKTTAIQIDSFSYTMVKRPEITKKGEKYQVKIDVEISSPTPKLAREFHNALIQPNDFVDPKAEVKWSSNRGKYRTSFYLKDKTVYLAPIKN